MTAPKSKARTVRQLEGDLEIMSAHVDRLIRDVRELTRELSKVTTVSNELSALVRKILAELKGTT